MSQADYQGLQQFEIGDVQNAKRPVRESELEGLEVRDREIPSAMDIDLSALDPDRQYRWVRNAQLRIARAKAKGYRFVDPSAEEVNDQNGDPIGEHVDGRVIVGDVVLMWTPKGEFIGRKKSLRVQNEKRLGSIKKQFKRLARSKGVETITNREE